MFIQNSQLEIRKALKARLVLAAGRILYNAPSMCERVRNETSSKDNRNVYSTHGCILFNIFFAPVGNINEGKYIFVYRLLKYSQLFLPDEYFK